MTRWPNPVFASVFVLTTLASTAALGYAYDYSGERESNLLECDRSRAHKLYISLCVYALC